MTFAPNRSKSAKALREMKSSIATITSIPNIKAKRINQILYWVYSPRSIIANKIMTHSTEVPISSLPRKSFLGKFLRNRQKEEGYKKAIAPRSRCRNPVPKATAFKER